MALPKSLEIPIRDRKVAQHSALGLDVADAMGNLNGVFEVADRLVILALRAIRDTPVVVKIFERADVPDRGRDCEAVRAG